MKFRRLFSLIAGVLFITSLAIFTSHAQEAEKDTSTLVGKPAPDFTLQTLDGKEVKLADQKGSVVVLDFWATWCPPCRKSLPHLQSVSQNQDLAEKGLKVFAVNAREDKEKIEPFMKQNNYTFTVPMDKDGKVLKDYLVTGIPTTVIIDRDGKIKNVFIGYSGDESAKELDNAIQAVLKASPKTPA
ncbi:MAG: TlpA family protein disulfide reductase [Bacillota bacterium]